MPNTELTTMCMIADRESRKVVVIDRVKSWKGASFPGGHVEEGESIVASAVREVKEETGLDVTGLRPCGIAHWCNDRTGDRYFVFQFKTDQWSGALLDETHEGSVRWVGIDDLPNLDWARGLRERLPMFLEGKYCEGFAVWGSEKSDRMQFL